jgi:Sodium/hydrogen exchanger family
LLASRYFLPPLFRSIAKLPELMLVTSLAWCFLICAGANFAGLSREMGALVAGVALSSLPYNVDIVAKVVSIRDFFVTLFFVALGMKIPLPTPKRLIFLGFFRHASSLLHEFEQQSPNGARHPLKYIDRGLVGIANFASLARQGIRAEAPPGKGSVLSV